MKYKYLPLYVGILFVPLAASAEICTDFDENLNVIEYDCATKKTINDNVKTNQSDNKGYIRAAYAFSNETELLGAGGLRFMQDKTFYDIELAAAYMSSDAADSYSLFLNLRAGYNLNQMFALYGGLGIGYSYMDVTHSRSFYMHDYYASQIIEEVYEYSAEEHGLSARISLGAEYNIKQNIGLFAEYTYLSQIAENETYKTNLFSFGVKYTF